MDLAPGGWCLWAGGRQTCEEAAGWSQNCSLEFVNTFQGFGFRTTGDGAKQRECVGATAQTVADGNGNCCGPEKARGFWQRLAGRARLRMAHCSLLPGQALEKLQPAHLDIYQLVWVGNSFFTLTILLTTPSRSPDGPLSGQARMNQTRVSEPRQVVGIDCPWVAR